MSLVISSVSSSESGNLLACGTSMNDVNIMDRRLKDVVVGQFQAHNKMVKQVKLDPSAKICISSAADGQIRLWDVSRKQSIRSFKQCGGLQIGYAFAQDAQFKTIYSGSKEGRIFRISVLEESIVQIAEIGTPILSLAYDQA